MATKIKTFDWSQPSAITTPNEKVVYPWDEWLDGDIWQLTEGEDFETHPLMMERIIRTRATARGAKVRLRHQPINGNSPFGVVILQRSDVKGPAEARKAEQASKRAAKTAEAKKAAAETLKQAGIKPVKKAVAKTSAAPKATDNGNGAAKKAVSKRPHKPTNVSKRPVKKLVTA